MRANGKCDPQSATFSQLEPPIWDTADPSPQIDHSATRTPLKRALVGCSANVSTVKPSKLASHSHSQQSSIVYNRRLRIKRSGSRDVHSGERRQVERGRGGAETRCVIGICIIEPIIQFILTITIRR